MKEKKDPTTLKVFFSLCLVPLLFLCCNPCFLLAYKRGSKAPHEGEIEIRTRLNHEIKTQEHDTNTRLRGDRALSTRSLLPSETWDPLPLLPVCNPYCKPSVGNTSSSKLDVGMFCPNQYKSMCPSSTPSELDA